MIMKTPNGGMKDTSPIVTIILETPILGFNGMIISGYMGTVVGTRQL